jgi:hypothetical protein
VNPRFAFLLWILAFDITPAATSLEAPLKSILSVDREGAGNPAAAEAWMTISAASSDELPQLIHALRDANPLAANYLRAAIDTVMEREISAGRTLPLGPLSDILLDSRAGEPARATAFDLIQRSDPAAAAQLVPGFLHDPNVQLRRLAVARLIDQAAVADKDNQPDSALLLYSQAMSAARDVDQIKSLATILAKRGRPVDLPRQLGFLMHWESVGPFDNTKGEGFERVYPPETEWNPGGTYTGKLGEVHWQPLVTSDSYGKVDFNVPYSMLKETVAYAHTVFTSEKNQDVELRLGCKNAWKIWVNGKLLFGRDEYHRGQRIDQYILPTKFRAGPNEILVKCCQNEQTQDWTAQWEFQLRVCDSTGAAVLAVDRPPTPQPQEQRRRPVSAK